MTATLDEQTQFVDASGAPVVGGLLYFGVAGSDPKLNPTPIFSDRELTAALANPQTTDSLGRSTNKVWIPGKYSFRLSTSADVLIYQELDNGTTSSGVAILLAGSVAGSNTITAAAADTITAYTDGQQFTFKTVSINTDAVTFNVDGVGAKAVVKNFSKAILPGDFAANQTIIVVYNSTNDNFDWVNQKRLSNTFYEGSAVAAAATTDIWATDGDTLHITGTTGITSLGTAPNVGARKTLIFDGIVTLTNSANLALPGGVNYTTAAGDVLEVYADTTTQLDVRVHKKDGLATITISETTRETAITTTSGTAHEYTSIASGVDEIILMLSGVSLSGIDSLLIQIGDAGGYETSGYVGVVQESSTNTAFSIGFLLDKLGASATWSGAITLHRLDGNEWVARSMIAQSVASSVEKAAGVKTLTAELDRIRITVTGSNTFSTGTISALIR